MPPKKPSLVDDPLTERRFSELLDLQLETMLDRKLSTIIAPLLSSIKSLETKYTDLSKVCDQLQATQALQFSSVENMDLLSRSKNIIISGLQESANTKESIQDIINTTTASTSLANNSTIFEFYRLGSDMTRSRPVKVILASNDISSKMKKNAKILRQHGKFKGVYINPDLPPATNKENARLRKLAKEIRSSNPDDKVIIQKGMLLHNDNVIDRFSISNQQFQQNSAPTNNSK